MSEQPPARDPLRAIFPWIAATVVVLALAVTAGFLMAYLVASNRAAQAPDAALATATPRPTAPTTPVPAATPSPTDDATSQPRRTPTPSPFITPEPSPIEHTISRGESLSYIAGLYCTTVDDILELNDIANPNRIQVGQVILIPGGGCESPAPE